MRVGEKDGAVVRRATAEDASALCALVSDMEGAALDPEAFSRRLAAQLEDGRHACLVCEEGDEVLGMLNLRIEDQLHHARPAAEVMELVVASGLGAQLFEAARRLAVERDCEVLEVTSKLHRAEAHRFYERMGMRRTHVRLSMPPDEGGLR